MRPTLLHFRSVKEKTPLSYDANCTYDGRMLRFSSPKGDNKKCTFAFEKRFVAYEILAKRTGYRVGPGSYSPELYKPKIRSGSPYKDFHCNKNIANNGYYMVGNTMQFEPNLMLGSNKKFQKEKDLKLDSTYISTRYSRSAHTTHNSISVDKHQFEELNFEQKRRASNDLGKKSFSTAKKKKPIDRKARIKSLVKNRFKL